LYFFPNPNTNPVTSWVASYLDVPFKP